MIAYHTLSTVNKLQAQYISDIQTNIQNYLILTFKIQNSHG